MIYNVVNNAIKNTSGRGKIDIRSAYKGSRFEIEISDTGPGISQDQMKTLFSRFRKNPDPEKESTGIGLAITKSIADFHRIEIKLESEPGKGTNFFFLFPENS